VKLAELLETGELAISAVTRFELTCSRTLLPEPALS
jgi:hypothetical protein